ncbi:hypothetical protein ACH5RR_009636 [Cinchona calisaya]|uniref:Uncharacterized protein n=1 Tax=Cinchona calisaya TaxID=153742 RepID=A0ABD3AGN3_9GENT
MLPMKPLSTTEWMELLRSSDINEYSMLDQITWLCLAVLSTTTALVGLRQVILPFWKSDPRYLGYPAMGFIFIHGFCVTLAMYCGRGKAFRCLGKVGKLIIEVISASVAATVRYFLGYNIFYLMILAGLTTDLYVFPHFLQIACDIGIWDILFGLVMQIVGFMVVRNIYTVTPFFLLCAGVIFYRYKSYSPPQIPDCDEEPSGSVN